MCFQSSTSFSVLMGPFGSSRITCLCYGCIFYWLIAKIFKVFLSRVALQPSLNFFSRALLIFFHFFMLGKPFFILHLYYLPEVSFFQFNLTGDDTAYCISKFLIWDFSSFLTFKKLLLTTLYYFEIFNVRDLILVLKLDIKDDPISFEW